MNNQRLISRLPAWEKKAAVLLAGFYLVGLAGHFSPRFHPLMLTLTPYVLLLTAAAGFGPYIIEGRRRVLAWAGLTFLVTLVLEIAGVATGLVFGHYDYGATLGPQVFGVPVVIGINWTLVILGAMAVAGTVTGNPWLVVLITALLCVGFDLILEPVAIALDYWSWEGGRIPRQNYLAWGVISFVFAGLFKWRRLKSDHLLPPAIFIIQALFFLVLLLGSA